MTVRPILTWPHPALSARCTAAAGMQGLAALAFDMLDTMYAAPGRGLAAPQVGVTRRLFVMDAGWKEGAPTPLVCVDPAIVWASEEVVAMEEGCLSILGIAVSVLRPASIRLRFADLSGAVHELPMDGAAARIAQHEADHLDGIVHFDRLSPDEAAVQRARYAATIERGATAGDRGTLSG